MRHRHQPQQSLLRKIAAGLGVSYEEFSRDHSQSNYSSARAPMLHTWKSMPARRRWWQTASATLVYACGSRRPSTPADSLPAGASPAFFYEGRTRKLPSFCRVDRASRRQIDEPKEIRRGARINPACPPTRTRSPAPARTSARCRAASARGADAETGRRHRHEAGQDNAGGTLSPTSRPRPELHFADNPDGNA